MMHGLTNPKRTYVVRWPQGKDSLTKSLVLPIRPSHLITLYPILSCTTSKLDPPP